MTSEETNHTFIETPTFSDELSRVSKVKDPDEKFNAFKRLLSSQTSFLDVTGHEKLFLAFMINIAAGETEKLTSLVTARKHLKDKAFIKKSLDCFKGWLSHNPKMFDSTNVGRYLKRPAEKTEPDHYVYSDSISGGKTTGYAQNGSLVRQQKWLFTEFYFQDRLTCLAQELADGGSNFGNVLKEMGLIDEGLRKLAEKAKETLSEGGIPSEPIGKCQIIVQKSEGYDIALSPVSSHRVQSQLQQRLSQPEHYRLSQSVQIGSGVNSPTFGNLVSDCGGTLKLLRADNRITLGQLRVVYHQIECGDWPFASIDVEQVGPMEFRSFRDKGTGKEAAYLNFRHASKIRTQIAELVQAMLYPIRGVRRKLKDSDLWIGFYQSLLEALEKKIEDTPRENDKKAVNKQTDNLMERVALLRYFLDDDFEKNTVIKLISRNLIIRLESQLEFLLPDNIKKFVTNDCAKLLSRELNNGE